MKQHNNHSADVVVSLTLFCVFASAVLMVLISGAGAYRGIASVLKEQYEQRVCINYIAAKVRHYDTAGMVSVGTFGDGDALFLDEEYDGTTFRTAIYCHNGSIMELFSELGETLDADAGEEIINAGSLSVSQEENGLLRIECTGSCGEKDELILCLRTEKGAA